MSDDIRRMHQDPMKVAALAAAFGCEPEDVVFEEIGPLRITVTAEVLSRLRGQKGAFEDLVRFIGDEARSAFEETMIAHLNPYRGADSIPTLAPE